VGQVHSCTASRGAKGVLPSLDHVYPHPARFYEFLIAGSAPALANQPRSRSQSARACTPSLLARLAMPKGQRAKPVMLCAGVAHSSGMARPEQGERRSREQRLHAGLRPLVSVHAAACPPVPATTHRSAIAGIEPTAGDAIAGSVHSPG